MFNFLFDLFSAFGLFRLLVFAGLIFFAPLVIDITSKLPGGPFAFVVPLGLIKMIRQ